MAVAPQRQWVRSTIESLWFIAPVALAYLFLLAISWQPDTLSLMMPGSIEEGIASGDFAPLKPPGGMCTPSAARSSSAITR